jgi:hypothetical protein
VALRTAKINENSRIKWPLLEEEDLDHLTISYDESLDTLYLFFEGKSTPAVWSLRDDNRSYVGLRLIDSFDWTNEAVGIMVEHFRHVEVQHHPEWVAILATEKENQRVAIRPLIDHIASMPAGGDETQ